MKRALFVLTVMALWPAIAHATPVDSMLGPFRLPFFISVQVHGLFADTNLPNGKTYYRADSIRDSFYVAADSISVDNGDTTVWHNDRGFPVSYAQLKDDTIKIFQRFGGGKVGTETCDIALDTSSRSVLNIKIEHATTYNSLEGPPETWSIELSNFRYDSTIYTNDSSTTLHNASVEYSACGLYSHGFSQCLDWESLSKLYSIDVSGLFRPAHLENPDAIVTMPSVEGGRSMLSIDPQQTCHFSVAPYLRTLEVYTPLGVKYASFEILTGVSSFPIPKLPHGFFFVRLEDAVAKMFVPN